jgi:hypothetical protein
MEYYSKSLKCWMSGMLQVKRLENEEDASASTGHVYNVTLCTKQRRLHVQFDCLRTQLKKGEEVEIFTGRKWRTGEVLGRCHHGVVLGYQVRLAAQGDGQQPRELSVFGTHVRRYFAGPMQVEVYRGPVEGWVPGRVPAGRRSSEAVGTAPELVAEDNATDGASNCVSATLESSPAASPRTVSMTKRASDGLVVEAEPWSTVPVIITGRGGHQDPEVEMVPSYLVRRAQETATAAGCPAAAQEQLPLPVSHGQVVDVDMGDADEVFQV